MLCDNILYKVFINSTFTTLYGIRVTVRKTIEELTTKQDAPRFRIRQELIFDAFRNADRSGRSTTNSLLLCNWELVLYLTTRTSHGTCPPDPLTANLNDLGSK